MQTGNRFHGFDARSLARRSVQALALVSLFGLAPMAASTAAAPDASAGGIAPATSAAMIELMPAEPTADVPTLLQDTAPSAPQETVLARGSASFYAARFDGRRTASGERFDNSAMTAAHRTLPFGSRVRVTNPANGRSVVVRVNDRGPFTRGRLIDVSRAAAEELGMVSRGHAHVELALIEG